MPNGWLWLLAPREISGLAAMVMFPAFLPYQSETIGGRDLYFCVMQTLLYCRLEVEAVVPAASVLRHVTSLNASPFDHQNYIKLLSMMLVASVYQLGCWSNHQTKSRNLNLTSGTSSSSVFGVEPK